MHQVRNDWSYEQCIESLENALETFCITGVNLTDARKMIQVRFKEHLNSMLQLA